jgi:AraC-like DNA-binding protein
MNVRRYAPTSQLQRRLAVEGTSFQALEDELRRALTLGRVDSHPVRLAALASELEFAASAVLPRAFKGRTGSAPGAHRPGTI